jgi:hypothetical protein
MGLCLEPERSDAPWCPPILGYDPCTNIEIIESNMGYLVFHFVMIPGFIAWIGYAANGQFHGEFNSCVYLAIGVAVALFIYLLPATIAKSRRYANWVGIYILNVFFGATLVGWVVSLILSLAVAVPQEVVIRHHYPKGDQRNENA